MKETAVIRNVTAGNLITFEKDVSAKHSGKKSVSKAKKTKRSKTSTDKLNTVPAENFVNEPESESLRKSQQGLPVAEQPKPSTAVLETPKKHSKLQKITKKKTKAKTQPIPIVDSSEPEKPIRATYSESAPSTTKSEKNRKRSAKSSSATHKLQKSRKRKTKERRDTPTSNSETRRKLRKRKTKRSCDVDTENSEEDYFSDQFLFELNEDADFVCLTEADIVAEQTREISEVAEILSVSESAAITLLKHFKWNRDKLMTSYFDNPSGVLESAGVGEDSVGVNVSSRPLDASSKVEEEYDDKEVECTICSMDYLPKEMYSLESCGHSFCECCWETYLTIQIKDGQAFMKCAQMNCSALVPENDVKRLVEASVFQKYCTFFMQSFVDNNDNVKWCPAPGCGNAVTSDMVSDKTVTCACSYRFCFQCSEEAHQPATCEQVKMWKKKCQDESETNNWIIANTQECPKCSLPTEKNGGCNHMTCRQCKHEYCWICNKDWKGHNDYYSCNRFQKSKSDKKSGKKSSRKDREQQRLEMRRALEKYLHYHSRFVNHSKSKELEATSERAMKHMRQMKATESTDAEVVFIEQATKQLIVARSVLKYSYVRRYYMEDEANSTALFEFFQADLEKTAEELSENLNNPMKNKFHIVNLTTLIETHVQNMIAAVDKDQI